MRTILIDDERGNILLLNNMLKKHCPEVTVIGDADSADAAHKMICQLNPDLIFLDIKMPQKNGFDLLRLFEKINFSVIFVTGFDEYAIKAFEFNALDYILKPIDYVKLIAAVKKAKERVYSNSENIIHFVHSMEEKTNLIKKIKVHHSDKVQVIDLNDIIYISANRNYCEIVDTKKQVYVSAKSLSEYEELLAPIENFIRVNKSYIINSKYVNSYTKGSDCIIYMNGCDLEIEVSRRKKTGIILSLKK